MVRILTDYIAQACVAMEIQARRRQNEIDAVEDVMKSIEKLSGMEMAARELEMEWEKLKSEQRGLLDMLQSLIRIREIYMRTERRICDYGEGNAIKFRYPEITYIEIPVLKKEAIKTEKRIRL